MTKSPSLLLALTLCATAAGLSAQGTASPGPGGAPPRPSTDSGRIAGALAPAPAASPFLPAGHWAIAALRRLEALGLGGAAFDPGSSGISREEALRRLDAAAAQAATSGRPSLARLASAYLARLEEELGGSGAGEGGPRLLRGSAQAGFGGSRGLVLAGYDRDGQRFAPAPVPDGQAAFGAVALAAALPPHVALELAPRSVGDRRQLEGELVLHSGRLSAWAGRRAVGFGAAAEGSMVLGGAVTFTGLGFAADSLVLPWALRRIGPLRVEGFGSRLHAAGAVAHPGFLALRIQARPHPRLWVAASRAASFDGRGNTQLNIGEVPGFLIGNGGGNHGETENQVASVEAEWRPPTGAVPLAIYGEWAIDDVAFDFVRVPGVVAGVKLPALPGLPDVELGLERASFAPQAGVYPPWYRHSALPWIDQGVPLGHPLGGEGSEWLAYARADLAGARLRLELRGLRRHRGPENLFAPLRQGTSDGGALSLEWTPRSAMEWFANAEGERGPAWHSASVRTGVRLRL